MLFYRAGKIHILIIHHKTDYYEACKTTQTACNLAYAYCCSSIRTPCLPGNFHCFQFSERNILHINSIPAFHSFIIYRRFSEKQ